MKHLLVALTSVLVLLGGVYLINRQQTSELVMVAPEVVVNPEVPKPVKVPDIQTGHKNASYTIEGQSVTIVDGVSQIMVTPGSAVMVITEYFGNELRTDLDGDDDEDIVFLITQNPGGSGTFYYAVAALNTPAGYVGSDGFRLGDRIAPQSIDESTQSNHKNVVVVNFADREAGDTMVVPPSVNKSVYLKMDTATRRWTMVEPNFEGDSR